MVDDASRPHRPGASPKLLGSRPRHREARRHRRRAARAAGRRSAARRRSSRNVRLNVPRLEKPTSMQMSVTLRSVVAQQEHRPLDPAPLQVAVRRLAERRPERADEVRLRDVARCGPASATSSGSAYARSIASRARSSRRLGSSTARLTRGIPPDPTAPRQRHTRSRPAASGASDPRRVSGCPAGPADGGRARPPARPGPAPGHRRLRARQRAPPSRATIVGSSPSSRPRHQHDNARDGQRRGRPAPRR